MVADLKIVKKFEEVPSLGSWSVSWDKNDKIISLGSMWRELAHDRTINTLQDLYYSIDAASSSAIENAKNELSNSCPVANFHIAHPVDEHLKLAGTVERVNDQYVMTALVSYDHMPAVNRSHNLLDSLPQGIMVYQNGKPVFVNKVFAALLGFDSIEEAQSLKGMKGILSQSGWEELENHIEDHVSSFAKHKYFEFCLTKCDDTSIDAKCLLDLIDWDGAPANMLSIVDVAEVKTMDGESRISRKLFRKIFDLSPDVTMIIDIDNGRIIDVNSAFVEITGLARKDAVDAIANQLPIWADNTVREWLTHKMHSQTSARNMPVVLNARGGIYRQLQVSAESVSMDGKSVLLMVARDVSDDLTREREMKQSRDDATQASKTKSEFLANMSHEIRTPLNAILGFSEIISRELLGPAGSAKYVEYAEDIYSSGAHLLSIINDILDLSKVEAGQLDINEEEIDALEIVDDCVRLIQKQADNDQVNLHVDCPDNFSFCIDVKLVKQIVLNLLTNAVKFTPKGGDVYFKLSSTSDNVLVTVRDTGIGMTVKELNKAMEPFGQVDNEQARKHQGSGLGIPLIQAYAQKMQGDFMLSSESGKGTTAKVILPLHRPARD